MTRLSDKALGSQQSRVWVPQYNRREITPGIVHIGVGGFHRAHEAVYTDDLLGQSGAKSWGICGVGLRPEDMAMRDALVPQDCLYTVVTRSAEGNQARVIGSLVNYLFAPEQEEAVRDVLADPQTRIVSLTITEGGYGALPVPGSVFALLADALDRRRLSGAAPFTVLSCDNLPDNGKAAKRALLAAVLNHSGLANWIEQNVAFPNSMVDRITPQTTDADRASIREEFGLEDAWPVVCEPFKQWIIEDKFSNGRPPWELAGAQFVSDVAPYELMKLRLLNAGHSAIGYLGFLAGFEFIHEILTDDLFHEFLERLLDDEITPLLPPVPGIDLAGYKQTLLVRFANPTLGDQVTRICLDGSSKVPKFLLPSLHEALASGRSSRLLTLAVAGWMRYLTGIDEQGLSYVIDDPRAAELMARAKQGGTDPRPLLALTDIFGDLGQMAGFTRELEAELTRLHADGVRATLAAALR